MKHPIPVPVPIRINVTGVTHQYQWISVNATGVTHQCQCFIDKTTLSTYSPVAASMETSPFLLHR